MEQKYRRFAVLLAGAISISVLGASVDARAQSVQPVRFTQPPVIDGRLDDVVWAGAAKVTGFRQVQPGDNLEPSQQTDMLIGYDRRALYVAFRAHDASGRVRATLSRRDAITDDDVVGLYLDSFHDRRRAYYIFFNPYGIQADGIYTEGKPDPDLTVDLVMESKGTIDAGGYSVEAAIPFASLRYRSGRGDTSLWGLHVQRFIRRDRNEQISWMPLSRDRSSLLDQAGQLGAFEDVGEGRPLEIIPTGVATQVGAATAGGFANDRVDAEPGVTVNYGLTPTLNASLTANPDFAQVEADQLVLTLNQRFPILYDEKRPFFLEGVDAYQTPITIVHTRSIVDPDYAVKVTGKQGRTTIGVLFAADDASKTALRLKRDVGRDSTIGATVTGLFDGSRFSHLASADARVRLSDQTVLTGQLAGTFSNGPFRDAIAGGTRERYGDGLAYYGRLERRTRHTLTSVTASGTSPDYRADLGFTRRINTNSVHVQTSYNSEPKADAPLISWTATNVNYVQWDWQGRATWVYVYPQLHLNFRRQSFVRLYAYRDYERLFEEEFGVKRGPGRAGAFFGKDQRSVVWQGGNIQIGSSPTEAFAFSLTLSDSANTYDYDFGAGPKFPRVSPAALADPDAPLDPGPARAREVNLDMTWRPIDALRSSIEATRSKMVRNDTGLTAYDATLVSWRTTYQFTPFTFVRLRTDWSSADATLRGQYLFGWTPNPGTAIYAGYTDVATIDGFDERTGARVAGYRRNGRTVFLKVSYLLRTIL